MASTDEPECICPHDFRIALDVADEDTGTNVIVGHIVADFEEYLTLCTDTWYRLQKILERRTKQPKEDA